MPDGTEHGTGDESLTVDTATEALVDLLTREEDGEGTEDQEQETPATAGEDDEEGDTPAEESDDNEDDDSEESDTDGPAPKTRTIKVDGEEIEVDEEELVKGYSRTADYTKKTQKLAEERRAFQEEQTRVKEERARYATLLTRLEQALETRGAEPDWAQLRAELPPEEFAAQVAEWQLNNSKLQKVQAEAEQARQRVAQDRMSELQSRVDVETQKLVDAIPEWKDEAKLKAGQTELVEYAKTVGWTPEDLATVYDHRAVVMLRKAMLYDKAMAKAKAAKTPAPTRPATERTVNPVKPGAAPETNRRPAKALEKDMQRLRSSGRVEDATAAILKIPGLL
jgi:hypothetical protein